MQGERIFQGGREQMDNIPMRPPKLPGYDFVQMLGSGATATVYLYNQRMPGGGKGQRQNP